MSNGGACCLLGVCCPPTQRRVKVVAALTDECGLSDEQADRVADWFVEHVTAENMLLAIKAELAKRTDRV